MNNNIVAINITAGETLLNIQHVPIILYTEDATQSVDNIFDLRLDIGNTFYNYIYTNFINTVSGINIKRYCDININCIFYNPGKNSHTHVCKSLQEIHPLSIDNDKELVDDFIQQILSNGNGDVDEYLTRFGLTIDNKETIVKEFKKQVI